MLTDENDLPEETNKQLKVDRNELYSQSSRIDSKSTGDWLEAKQHAPVAQIRLCDCIRIATIDNFQVCPSTEHKHACHLSC